MNKEKETITITYDELKDFLKELGSKFDLQRYEVTLKGSGYHAREISGITDVMWKQLKSKNYDSGEVIHELFKEDIYDTFISIYSDVVSLIYHSRTHSYISIPHDEHTVYVNPPFHPMFLLRHFNSYTAEKIRESGILPKAIEVYHEADRIMKEQRKLNEKREKTSTKTTKGVVYLLERTDKPQYKIGVTTNMERRLNQLTPKMPFEVIVANKIKSNDIYGLEAKLHKKYKDKHINGEWFALDKKDVEYIKSIEGDF